MKPQILIGAASSGSGKTTFTMGLLRVLARRGLQVQPFKCGPDYIDTQFHSLASGRESVNLDTWLASESHVRSLYAHYGATAGVSVVEGVMGLFDGWQGMQGSSAALSMLLQIPVVLLVNARSTAYSVAPLIYGFRHFHPGLRLAGVVFNRVSSAMHYTYLKEACADAGVPCLGYLPVSDRLAMPSRHLGLALGARRAMEQQIEQAADAVEQHVEIDRLLEVCQAEEMQPEAPLFSGLSGARPLRVAMASDEVFNFTYRANVDWLAHQGELVRFSPLHDEELPEADLVYLPGGYPELFAHRLQRKRRTMEQLCDYVEAGGRLLAECGGMIYLCRSLTNRAGDKHYSMAGLLPMDCTMEQARLHLGYRRVCCGEETWQGHEFHYSALKQSEALPSVARQFTARGKQVDTPLYRYKNALAGYTHLYWAEKGMLSLFK